MEKSFNGRCEVERVVMAQHPQDPGEYPYPQGLLATKKVGVGLGNSEQNFRGLLDSDLQEVDSAQRLGSEMSPVGKGVVPLKTFQLDAGVDIDEHLVMSDTLLLCLQVLGLVLDLLDDADQLAELSSLVRP